MQKKYFKNAYIDEDECIVFYNVPKAATTTIRKLLFKNWVDHDTRDLINTNPHFGNCFKFLFCRNPFDRMVSTYSMFTQIPTRINYLRKCASNKNAEKMSFVDFIKFTLNQRNQHWMPQYHWTRNREIDFVGRYENLMEDLKYVVGKTSKNFEDLDIEHRNKTNHSHYSNYYNSEARELVLEKYECDFEYFNYSKELES